MQASGGMAFTSVQFKAEDMYASIHVSSLFCKQRGLHASQATSASFEHLPAFANISTSAPFLSGNKHLSTCTSSGALLQVVRHMGRSGHCRRLPLPSHASG